MYRPSQEPKGEAAAGDDRGATVADALTDRVDTLPFRPATPVPGRASSPVRYPVDDTEHVMDTTDETAVADPPATRAPEARGGGSRPTARRQHARKGGVYRRRRILAVCGVVLVAFLIWLGVSLGGALGNPALGSSWTGARLAKWARGHGGFQRHQLGGERGVPGITSRRSAGAPAGAIRRPGRSDVPVVGGTAPPHLALPAPIGRRQSPAVAGEGQWSAVGRRVGGLPAVYET